MTGARLAVVTALLSTAAPLLAACTGSSHTSAPTPASGAGSEPTSGAIATRWWSNAAATKGSTVAPSDSAVAALEPSRPAYCTMLRQTVAAGKSILPGAAPTDPALLGTTTAFLDELEKVAPAQVAGSWQVLGPVLISVVKSGGDLAGLKAHVDATAVSTAVATVSSDAKSGCGLNLSR